MFLSDESVGEMNCIGRVFVKDERLVADCVSFFFNKMGDDSGKGLVLSVDDFPFSTNGCNFTSF